MIDTVTVVPDVALYLKRHQLTSMFKKAVAKLVAGNNAGLDFKKRKPRSENIWSFRITKKYRAFARRQGSALTVYLIDDHQ